MDGLNECIKPFAVSEMSMLSYYHERHKSELEYLNILPASVYKGDSQTPARSQLKAYRKELQSFFASNSTEYIDKYVALCVFIVATYYFPTSCFWV